MDYEKILEKTDERLKQATVLQFPGTIPQGKIIVGCGVAKTIGEEASILLAERTLLVTDKTIVSTGMEQVVVKSLQKKEIKVDIYDDVVAEPHIEDMEVIVDKVHSAEYDLIIGLGGGSVLDTAKMASIISKTKCDIIDILNNYSIIKSRIPTILLPTTSGTGSEISPSLVVSAGEKKRFISTPYLYATIALIDPLLTSTMPPRVTAATGLDALSHAVEGVTGKTNPFTMAIAAKATELVFENLPKAVADGTDMQARYNMSFASALGMMAYIQGGGLYAHSMSYILTEKVNTPHGLGCGLALPYTLRYNETKIDEVMNMLQCAINNTGQFHSESTRQTIGCFYDLTKNIGMPTTLRELGISEEAISEYAQILIHDYYRKANPRTMNKGEANIFIKAMYEGNLNFSI